MRKFTIVLLFLFSISILNKSYSQNVRTWSGLGDGHTYTDMFNWSSDIVPLATDTIVFNTNANVDEIPDFFTFIGGIKINSGANVSFDFVLNINIHLINDLYIATSASLSLTDLNASTLRIINKADIYGEIFFDNAAHKIETYTVNGINFYAGSIFKTGINYTGFPFEQSGTNINTVLFKDASVFSYGNGNSPFGPEGMGGYITYFENGSYFEIYGGDGSLLNFSNKHLGNIVNSSGSNVTISSSSNVASLFSFNTLSTLNGAFTFVGNGFDKIDIYGGGINAENGNISLQTGADGIILSGPTIVMSGNSNIDFLINSPIIASYELLPADGTLLLENDLNIKSPDIVHDISVLGTVDCKLNRLVTSNINLKFNSLSTVLTANSGGLEASIPTADFTSNLNLIYNGTAGQVTGLNSFPPISLNNLKINNSSNVNLDKEVNVNVSLDITTGKLILNNNNLNLNSSIIISTQNTNSYIVTNNSGCVKVNSIAASTTFICPVGTSNYRTEIVYFSETSLGVLSLRAFDGVFSDGYSGTQLVFDNIIPITWEILPDITVSNANITLKWESTVNAVSFDILNAYISHHTISGWDNPGVTAGTTVADISSISRNNVGEFGLFHVSSRINTAPTSLDNTVVTAKNFDFIFHPHVFPIFDTDGDILSQIKIATTPTKGKLFIDYNQNLLDDAGEDVFVNQIISYEEILLMRFRPVIDQIGDAANNYYYTEFNFFVSDGISYNSVAKILTINVTNNNQPIGNYMEYIVKENQNAGDLIGKLDASDADADQVLTFKALDGDTLTFNISPQGEIFLKIPENIVFAVIPSYEIAVGVIDNGIPNLFTKFFIKISVENPGNSSLEIANLLTPNGDGHNDTWIIKGAPDATINYETFIYNYSGKLVFHSTGYNNDWNGTSEGKILSQGVYYYLLKSETEQIKGTITLLR